MHDGGRRTDQIWMKIRQGHPMGMVVWLTSHWIYRTVASLETLLTSKPNRLCQLQWHQNSFHSVSASPGAREQHPD